MDSNIPSRPTRIDHRELGMFSLSPLDSSATPSTETRSALTQVAHSIASTFAPRSVDALEQEFHLGVYAPVSLVRRVGKRVGLSKPENLSYRDRQIRVIDHLFAHTNPEIRNEAIYHVDRLDPETQQIYQPHIDELATTAINSTHMPIMRMGVDILGRVNPHLRDELLTTALHVVFTYGEVPDFNKVLEFVSHLDTPTQIRHIHTLLSIAAPSIQHQHKEGISLDLARRHGYRLDEEARLAFTKSFLSQGNGPRAVNLGLWMLAQCSPESQRAHLPEIYRAMRINELQHLQTSEPDFMNILYSFASSTRREIFLVMLRTYNPLWCDIVCSRIGELEPSDQLPVLLEVIPYSATSKRISCLKDQGRTLDSLSRSVLASKLLASPFPVYHDVGLYLMRNVENEHFRNHLDAITSYVATIGTHESTSLFLQELYQFSSSNRADLINALMDPSSSNKDMYASLEAMDLLLLAKSLDENDQAQLVEQRTNEFARYLRGSFSRQEKTLTCELLSFLPPEVFTQYEDLIHDHLMSQLREEEIGLRMAAIESMTRMKIQIEIDDDISCEKILREALLSEDGLRSLSAIQVILKLDSDLQIALSREVDQKLHTSLHSEDIYIFNRASQLASSLPDDRQAQFTEIMSDRLVHHVQQANGYVSSHSSLSLWPASVQKAVLDRILPLTESQLSTQISFMALIENLPSEYQSSYVSAMILDGMPGKTEFALALLERFPPDLAQTLMEETLLRLETVNDNQLRNYIVDRFSRLIDTLPRDQKSYLRDFLSPHLPSSTKSILHERASDTPTELTKTGSRTIILPRNDEASVRIIDTDTAHAWANAYLAVDKWADAGFDYVPVEPILDIHKTGHAEVSVTTVNLRGRSLSDAQNFISSYSPEIAEHIDEQHDQIVQVLNDMGLNHGHLHKNNFVLVPSTHDDGSVDFDVCPRLYVIDFDRAMFATNAPQLQSSSTPTASLSFDR